MKKALPLSGLAGNSFTQRGEGEAGLVRTRGEVVGKPFSSHRSILYGIQVDVPIGNFCWCFGSDTFNNTLLRRKYVINILII